jgi:transposase-like protein
MVTITLHCPHCGSDALVRDGHAPNGKQKYRCHGCGRRSRENPTPNAYPEARREEILHASSRTKQSTWPHAHLWGLSRNTSDSGKIVPTVPLALLCCFA